MKPKSNYNYNYDNGCQLDFEYDHFLVFCESKKTKLDANPPCIASYNYTD